MYCCTSFSYHFNKHVILLVFSSEAELTPLCGQMAFQPIRGILHPLTDQWRSPRGGKCWCLGLMPAVSVFHWLASASEKLPRLSFYITVWVSPWCAYTLARPDSGGPVTLTPSLLLIFMFIFWSVVTFYLQSWAFAQSLEHLLNFAVLRCLTH